MDHPLVLGFEQRVFELVQRCAGEIGLLVQDELEGAGQRALDRGTAQFGIALARVRVTDREQRALDRDRVVHGGALADAPVVDIAAGIAGRDGIDHVRFLRCDTGHAEVRPHRYAHVLQHAVVLFHRRVIDDDARVVDGLVHDAERVGLRRPLEVVHRLRPVAVQPGVDFVDGDHFAVLRLGDQVLVVEAPPGGRIDAEALALVRRVGARPRRHIDDAHLEHVAFFRTLHVHRTGTDVHAQAFAGAPAEQAGVHRPGAAPVHALFLLVPVEHALGARVALDHAVVIVTGVVGERFDGDEIARTDFHLRLQRLREIAPVHRVGAGRNEVVAARLHRAVRRPRDRTADQTRAQRAQPGSDRPFQKPPPRRILGRRIVDMRVTVAIDLDGQMTFRIAETAVLMCGMCAAGHVMRSLSGLGWRRKGSSPRAAFVPAGKCFQING
ncbi:hypothetical protein METUNv1_03249 [Methyloversatilis universalis FAM5]|uniref:Uncharacterized protein n=1 Tax=Methyloversatilis universalis (strain ATCC BAA-1314 / DSM 25237 / JCM 13912 / CCUG 52030 / FAM5) TaxID=1000565 RepID=F5RGF2_METUF|nr:hypothetical protein METUNv1_03249 [Methyloversatilis universalis FAM5]